MPPRIQTVFECEDQYIEQQRPGPAGATREAPDEEQHGHFADAGNEHERTVYACIQLEFLQGIDHVGHPPAHRDLVEDFKDNMTDNPVVQDRAERHIPQAQPLLLFCPSLTLRGDHGREQDGKDCKPGKEIIQIPHRNHPEHAHKSQAEHSVPDGRPAANAAVGNPQRRMLIDPDQPELHHHIGRLEKEVHGHEHGDHEPSPDAGPCRQCRNEEDAQRRSQHAEAETLFDRLNAVGNHTPGRLGNNADPVHERSDQSQLGSRDSDRFQKNRQIVGGCKASVVNELRQRKLKLYFFPVQCFLLGILQSPGPPFPMGFHEILCCLFLQT